jgi:hypothetical protein
MIDIFADEISKITIEKELVGGYLAWYKSTHYPHWTFISSIITQQNITTTPYPLFKNQEQIIDVIKKLNLNIDDIVVKVLKVTL